MRRRLVRGIALSVLVAAAAAAIARFVGLDGPHTVGLGAALLAAGAVVTTRPSSAPALDAELDPARRTGGRRDLDELAWAMLERRAHVRKIVVDRVREAASGRLEHRGLDPRRASDGPAIAALLGPVAWSVLDPQRTRPVLPGALDTTLRALQDLDAPAALPPSPNRSTRAD